jgi:hypothetical protein
MALAATLCDFEPGSPEAIPRADFREWRYLEPKDLLGGLRGQGRPVR